MIYPHHSIWPRIHETAFIAPSADIIGEVIIGEESSVWFQVVIRGDVNTIQIGARTNIQDHSMLHVTRRTSPLKLGDDITVGHRVTLHGCTLGNRILVGMGAIILDDAIIEDDVIVGAGALVPKKMRVPSGSLVYGSPAKVVRTLTEDERAFLLKSSKNYIGDIQDYRSYVHGPGRYGVDASELETMDDEDLESNLTADEGKNDPG